MLEKRKITNIEKIIVYCNLDKNLSQSIDNEIF